MAKLNVSELTDVDWPAAMRFLTGEELPTEMAAGAVEAIERDADREEREEADRRRDWVRAKHESRAALREVLAQNDQLARAKERIGPLLKKWREYEPPERQIEREEATLSLGSATAKVVPPYQLNWGKEAGGGPVQMHTEQRKSDGWMIADVACPEDGDGSWGVGFSGLGIIFKPIFGGNLVFTATLSPIYFWYTGCTFADARSYGWYGLRVYRFRLDGTQDPPDTWYQKTTVQIWSDESWWSGEGPNEGIAPQAFGLNFGVSKDYYYALWAYYRVKASADGGGVFYDSAARAEMNGVVPSLTWNFTT
jgi:hypothetical protein